MSDFSQFREKCKRKNSVENNRLHWFSSLFSVYFSFLFHKLKMSADQVTITFFIAGLIGAFLYVPDSITYTIIGYVFFRLHIIIDMSDGDIARYNQTFSIRGAYWDSMIHAVLNPLYFISIGYSFYLQFGDVLFILLGAVGGLTLSLTMAVKNNFYKALYNNGSLQPKSPGANKKVLKSGFKDRLMFIISELLSIEGLVAFTIVLRVLHLQNLTLAFLALIILGNLGLVLLKFYMYSYKGYTYSKN